MYIWSVILNISKDSWILNLRQFSSISYFNYFDNTWCPTNHRNCFRTIFDRVLLKFVYRNSQITYIVSTSWILTPSRHTFRSLQIIFTTLIWPDIILLHLRVIFLKQFELGSCRNGSACNQYFLKCLHFFCLWPPSDWNVL